MRGEVGRRSYSSIEACQQRKCKPTGGLQLRAIGRPKWQDVAIPEHPKIERTANNSIRRETTRDDRWPSGSYWAHVIIERRPSN
ncbi:hypothetical protein CC1G_14264 [Coprinopsis cinerea okayama7|uniref:Uncharacterized protein n=1 Tax=Coprinopsis cinerea (strain Okayama-7 / 130 / ATCC MYA-4618 / FGSC 9003) TaxID=240176 RepID=D6RLF5_COPC7|nr:hypothetical protein CC1G_14264 [Coprinopsis cinerea okayama7\|eukprot:XP_002911733.1 hypothetical protein CC1G_14264 [Coprinopsis cinerea okayama7\